MRKLLLGLVGATALAFGSASNATVTIDSTSMVTAENDAGLTFAIGYTDVSSSSPFSEFITWTETLAGTYGITLSTTADGGVNGPTDVDFTKVFLSGGSIVGELLLNPDVDNTDQNEDYFLSGLFLDAGTYTLRIEGTRGETAGFGGNIAFTAIPEPGTWAMMLLGFGAIGFAMRRRRQPVLAQVA